MISSALPILSLVALSAAQSSTVSLFLPFADPQNLVASIAGSDSTETTYVVNCASPAASATAAAASASATGLDAFGSAGDNECGFPTAITVVQGPSTVQYAVSVGEVGTESINCQLMGSTRAICTIAASGSVLLAASNSIPALTTATLSATEVSFIPVVITAGSATAKETASSRSSPTGSAHTITTGTGTTKSTGTASTTSGTMTGSSSSATVQSTNAAMQGTPAFGAGVFGALGVAVAGAIL